jgi:hypothetical protein
LPRNWERALSALSLKRTLEIGSYQTAWAVLHRLRSVLVRPGRERLTGTVEVDETYIGGEEAGLPGARAKGQEGADRYCKKLGSVLYFTLPFPVSPPWPDPYDWSFPAPPTT